MNNSQQFHSKMEMESLKLKWSNHSPNFISVFSQLLNSESLVDVTLAADGKTIQGIHFNDNFILCKLYFIINYLSLNFSTSSCAISL